jgi:uncharacterized phosphosugar-binding protein
MTYANQYFDRVYQLLHTIQVEELDKIKTVAQVVAHSMADGGILHLFGSGHSAIPTHEVYIRAGSLTNTRPVSLERILDSFERIEGVGMSLMRSFDGRPGECSSSSRIQA